MPVNYIFFLLSNKKVLSVILNIILVISVRNVLSTKYAPRQAMYKERVLACILVQFIVDI